MNYNSLSLDVSDMLSYSDINWLVFRIHVVHYCMVTIDHAVRTEISLWVRWIYVYCTWGLNKNLLFYHLAHLDGCDIIYYKYRLKRSPRYRLLHAPSHCYNFWNWFFGTSEESVIIKNLWSVELVLFSNSNTCSVE